MPHSARFREELHVPEDPEVKRIEENLRKALEAARKGPEAFGQLFDELFPPEPSEETPENR
jgi:hypothetical protein